MEESTGSEPNKSAKPLKFAPGHFPSSAERVAKRRAIDPDKPLSRRERVIVAEFAKDLNLTAACARSGLCRNPDARAHEIQQRANVKKALDVVVLERERASEVSVERLVKAYSEFAFAEHVGPILPSHRLAALDSLAKWRRMFQPEAQVTVPVVFQFIGGPEMAPDGKTIESASTLALTTDSREKPR